MELYSEQEIREAARFTAIGSGLLDQLFNAIKELRSENSVLAIYQKAMEIAKSDRDWEQKYDLIFSDEISKKVNHLFEYADPDTSYQEDTIAFMNAFTEYIQSITQ